MLITLLVLVINALTWGAILPAGDQLLYITQPHTDGRAMLYTHDLRHNLQYELLDTLSWGADAVWSPDGTQIAFIAFGPSSVRRDLFRLGVSSGEIHQILDDNLLDHDSISWSPDGKFLIYQGLTEDRSWDIFIHDLQGGESEVLYSTIRADTHPVWSPDGRSIAFESISNLGNIAIHILDMESRSVRLLTNSPQNAITPSWSPDGEEIIFSLMNNTSGYDLYTINKDGTTMRRLTRYANAEYYPTWSPDGTQIAFVAYLSTDFRLNVYTQDADGQLRRITGGEIGFTQPDWRP